MEKERLLFTQNRELSWLRFNQRVLQEAQDESVPLLERMKFVAIFTSNLDEFFMIRVGSLFDKHQMDPKTLDVCTKMTAKEQLEKIYEAVAPLYKERDQTYSEIKKLLHPYGVLGLDYKELDGFEKKYVKKYFKEKILPILSPQIVDVNHPFPHLLNKEIYVVATLIRQTKLMNAIVPVPSYVSDILYLPGEEIRYIRMEKIILEYMELIFQEYKVVEKNYLCVTRNADISPEDEFANRTDDFRHIMKKTLNKRHRMAVVRLETAEQLSKSAETFYCHKLAIKPKQIYRTKMPMKLDYIFTISEKLPAEKRRTLVFHPYTPQNSIRVSDGPLTPQIFKKDLLLFYPYESMNPFLKLVKEAATDPAVLTIKITIYRLAAQARLVEYLSAAAENGKEVTVLIELRARFDEKNNIDWSERLEEAGCHILYGFESYKVHSKVCLITYRHRNEIRYITQVGTGNYNEKTATMYTDFSFITANHSIGKDANQFFKNMGIGKVSGLYDHLIVSPSTLKPHILYLCDEEIKKGAKGHIIMKMNALTDIDFIQKIEEASRAGVRIDLQVRGVCCLLPQIKNHTENVKITSIVGRYLEHPRVFAFGQGEEQKIYLGSADMMTRNTEKRVEIAVPLYDADIKAQMNHYLAVLLNDNVKARVMQSDGTYAKKEPREPLLNAQETFMSEALNRISLDPSFLKTKKKKVLRYLQEKIKDMRK